MSLVSRDEGEVREVGWGKGGGGLGSSGRNHSSPSTDIRGEIFAGKLGNFILVGIVLNYCFLMIVSFKVPKHYLFGFLFVTRDHLISHMTYVLKKH